MTTDHFLRLQRAHHSPTPHQVFNVLTVAAVVTNCLIVGYTSTVLTHVYGLSGAQVRVLGQ